MLSTRSDLNHENGLWVDLIKGWWLSCLQEGLKVGSIGLLALGARIAGKGNYMKNTKEFPFEKARRVTTREVEEARKAIERKTGKKRKARGRPPKHPLEKYRFISIRIHPRVIVWAKKRAKQRGVGYQTI